jgi:hypothetical protein
MGERSIRWSRAAATDRKPSGCGRAPNGYQRSGARVWRTADGDLTNQASRIGRSVAFKRHRGLVAGATVRSIARPNNDTAKKELIGIDLGDC